MPAVNLTINGRLYEVLCDETQVERVRSLAIELDDRAKGLLMSLGSQPEARLLLMLSLTLADELVEAKAATEAVEARARALVDREVALTKVVVDLSEQIESIAQRLERS